jgi:hypothetical protein
VLARKVPSIVEGSRVVAVIVVVSIQIAAATKVEYEMMI